MQSQQETTRLPTMEEVVALMAETLKGNNETIQKATKILKEYTNDIISVQVLLNLLLNANDAGIRQLCTVLLKRNINHHYLNMEPNDQKFLKQALLERYFIEPQRPVRRGIGFLIGVLTEVTLPKQDWNELLELISQRTDSQQPVEVRESAIYLLSLILDISGQHLESHFTNFYKFFSNTIVDSSKAIRYQSLKCILILLESVKDNDNLSLFSNLVEAVLKTVNDAIDDRQDEIVHLAFVVFCQLSEIESPMFNDKIYTALVYFICSDRVLMNPNMDISTQEVAIDLVADIAESHKPVLAKNLELLQHVVDTMCALTMNKSKPQGLDDAESIQDLALMLILDLAGQIAKKKIYPIFKKNIDKLIQANDPWKLEAALFILGSISQGCCEYLKRDLDVIINTYVQAALSNQIPEVRASGIYAICYFAENLCPDILSYHKVIIPALLKHVDDADTVVAQRAIFTIDLFCQNMEDDIAEYAELLIPSFLTVLDNAKSTMVMRRICISSISSVIESGGEKVIHQIPKLAPLMGQLVKQIPGNSELLPLRAQATSCLGKMADLLRNDRESYLKIIHPYVDPIWLGLKEITDPALRENSFAFFYSVAHCLKDDFKPFLEPIMELIYEAIASNDGMNRKETPNQNPLEEDSCSDEEDPDYYKAGADVNMEYIEEKNAAIHAVGEFAKACPLLFVPYFERSIKMLELVYDFWYANTREQVCVCYTNLIEGLVMASNGGKLPQYTRGLPCLQRFEDKIEEFIHIDYYTKICHYLIEDDSADVSSQTLEILLAGIQKLGPAFVDRSLDRLMEALLQLLQNRGACQTGEADDSDDVDVNGLIFGNVTDLLPVLAKTLKSGFVPAYKTIHKTMKKFIKTNKGYDDISQTIGVFGECFKYVPELIQGYCEELLPSIIDAIELNDENINRNVAFTLGVFCAHGKDCMLAYYPKIMQAMKSIYDTATTAETKDNAVAAIAKMTFTNAAKMPLNLVVPTIMGVLPFQGDLKENKTAVRFIIYFLETNAQALNGYEEKAIMVLIDAVANWTKYKLKEKYVKACGVTLKALGGSNEQVKKIIETYAAKLQQKEFSYLVQVMS